MNKIQMENMVCIFSKIHSSFANGEFFNSCWNLTNMPVWLTFVEGQVCMYVLCIYVIWYVCALAGYIHKVNTEQWFIHVRLQLFCINTFLSEIDNLCLGNISMTTVTKIHMLIIDIIMDLTRACVCMHAWVRVSVSLFPGTLGTYVRARVCMYINYISVFVLYEYVLPLNFYSRWCAVTLCLWSVYITLRIW